MKNTILKKSNLGKSIFHRTKKRKVCDVNCKPFGKCKCFVSKISSLNMLNSNVKKWKKHNFKIKPLKADSSRY